VKKGLWLLSTACCVTMTQTGATAPAYLRLTSSGTKTEFYINLLITAS